MIFRRLVIEGSYAVVPEPVFDERGSFARTVSTSDFLGNGCDGRFTEQSVAYNVLAGTLRGMHFQREPHGEGKLVRCTRGAVYDVLVDTRHDSPSFRCWHAEELDADNRIAIYLPPGVAHGYLTLKAHSELVYATTVRYVPEAAAGFRYDDPSVGIQWPSTPAVVSARDRALPAFPG